MKKISYSNWISENLLLCIKTLKILEKTSKTFFWWKIIDKSKILILKWFLSIFKQKNYYLNRSAKDAYRSYLMAYSSHSHKDIFNVHNIDLQGVGKAFGFSVPPSVNLNIKVSGKKVML